MAKRAGDRPAVKSRRATLNAQLKAIEGELINLDFEKPRPARIA